MAQLHEATGKKDEAASWRKKLDARKTAESKPVAKKPWPCSDIMGDGGTALAIHDWTRVRANQFHHFHQTWTANLAAALNSGRLRPGFFALGEQITGGAPGANSARWVKYHKFRHKSDRPFQPSSYSLNCRAIGDLSPQFQMDKRASAAISFSGSCSVRMNDSSDRTAITPDSRTR
jgi:hypothetical protein